MKKEKLKYNLGGFYGLLSTSFGIIGDVIAFLLYPGYDFTKNAVSTLCKGPGGIYFQLGTVISGFFAVLFVISFSKVFNEDEVNAKLISATVIIALISCISFIGLGAFCGSNPVVALIHGSFAVVSWISGLLYITLFNVMMLKDSSFPKTLAYVGFWASLVLSSLIILFLLYYIPGLQFILIILSSLEWFNTFSLIGWYLIVSIYFIYKKR